MCCHFVRISGHSIFGKGDSEESGHSDLRTKVFAVHGTSTRPQLLNTALPLSPTTLSPSSSPFPHHSYGFDWKVLSY